MNAATTVFPGFERIAYRSTRGEGVFRKSRWMEIGLHYRPDALNPFVLRVEGHSTVRNERTIRWTHRARTLKLILERLEDNAPGRAMRKQALAWANEQGVPLDG